MKKEKFAIVALVLIACLMGLVIAQLIMTREITTNVIVTGVYDFQVYEDTGCTIPCVVVNWSICRNGEAHDQTIYVKNTGNDMLYVSWNTTGMPADMTLTADDWVENSKTGFNAGTKRDFRMHLSTTAPVGEYSFTLTFYAWESDT